MSNAVISTSGHVNLMARLIKRLESYGVDVPKDLIEEAKLRDSLQIIEAKNQSDRQHAMQNLLTVSPSDFEAELSKAEQLWTKTATLDRDNLSHQIDLIKYRRLFNGLYDASGVIFKGLANAMNDVVAQFGLNDVVLPSNLPSFDVMRATPEDIQAVQAYRAASPILNPIWQDYKFVANHMGHDLSIDMDTSSSLDVAFILGDLTDFRIAEAITVDLFAAQQNLTSMTNVSAIKPWGVFGLRGVRIDVKTFEQARALRNKVQFDINPGNVA